MKRIPTAKFAEQLFSLVKQNTPRGCRPRLNSRHDEIIFDNCLSSRSLKNCLKDAIESMGYELWEVDTGDYDLAAVDPANDSFVKLWTIYDAYGDDDPVGYVNIQGDNGSVTLEDWYDGSQSIESASELPAGYLGTTKFTAPAIQTDAQRNALEALEIAISEKYEQFDKMMDRQMYFTSDTSWTGTITEYERGYYIELEATRSRFSAFVDGDHVTRKPVNPGELLAKYDVDGNSGTVYWMSSGRI